MQPLILVIYDECIFLAYNGSWSLWILNKEQPLWKKGNGCSIHISEFLTDICGRLALSNKMQMSDDLLRKACVIMYSEKNNDGWWKAENLINQVVKRAIPIFEVRFSGCQTLFAFNNILNYTTFLPNILVVKYINFSFNKK